MTRDFPWGVTLFFGFLILMIVLVAIGGIGKDDDARRVLSAQGYSNIELTGYRPLMGDRNDWYSTGFRARSVSGATVTGAVTSGPAKGYTIRLD